MRKRIAAILLAFVLILGQVPADAFAAVTINDVLGSLPVSANPGTGTTAWKAAEGGILQSGTKGKAYSTGTLTLTFTADTHFSFEYKVSTEEKYDKFTVTHGSTTLVNEVSGEIDWTRIELDAAAGDVLTCVYKKDSSGDKGDDCVYLRNFSAGAPLVITFHNNEESGTQNIYGGSGTLRANTFVQAGKVFAGWATAPEGEVVYPDGTAITLEGNLDLYAVWSDAYTVTFDNQGTSSEVYVAQNYAIGAANIPTVTAPTGYLFDGWYAGEEKLSPETVITEDVTYTASFLPIPYTISFHANGGTGSMEKISARYDTDVTLPESGFVRQGYSFRGWAKSSYSSSADYQPGGTVRNLKNQQNSEQILYAVWGGDPVSVTVDLNYKGADSIQRTGVVGENYNYIREDNGNKTFSTLSTPKREGYNFKGWYDAPTGGTVISTSYKFTAEDAETGITLYAQWAEAVTVTFDANGGSCSIKEKSLDRGTSYGTLPSCSLSGKKFEGWYTALEGGEKAENNRVFNESTTLYARFRSYHITVSFDANGGTGVMEPFICESGMTKNLPACEFTREGYQFVQWTTIKNPSSWQSPKYYGEEGSYTWSSSYSDSTATLYAVWEQVEELTPEGILTEAADSLTGYFTPKYGRDTNANEAMEALLAANGYEDITVTMKEAAVYDRDGGSASIDGDGTIHYYYNPSMSGRGGVYFDAVFLLSYNGSSVEKTWTTHMNWDEAKARETLRAELSRLQLPTEIGEDGLENLPHYLLTEGVSPEQADYNDYTDFDTWAAITWTSSSNAITIGTLPGYPYYAPYPVTVRQGNKDQKVTLTAHMVWNSGDNVELYKVYTITVTGSEAQVPLEEELQTKLDNALETVGLTDLATGEPLDLTRVTGDIQFPTTRDMHIDGKYQPVTITSSNPDVIQTWDTNNAASAIVYRPLPGEEPAAVTLTIRITDKATNTVVSREIPVTVLPLTQKEIADELALMEQVKAHYFDGIKGGNEDPEHITANLSPFFEAYSDEAGNLVWVYRNSEKKGNGIVPAAMDGWYDTEQWRLFKSSNMDVITHENLLVTRQAEHKAVTITSWLSSESMERYAERYPEQEAFQKLANQPVTVDLIVIGTNPTTDKPEQKNRTVTFTLRDTESEWLTATVSELPEGTTVAEVFARVLKEHGYTYMGSSYIRSITRPDGTTLAELAYGPNSGWKYKVNGVAPSKVITQQTLEDGDQICFYYTNDYTQDVEEGTGDKKEPSAAPEMPSVNGENIYITVGNKIETTAPAVFGSEWMILGLVRSGREIPEGYYENVVEYVRGNIDTQGRLDPSKSTENSRLILSLTAAGYDVTNVDGHNLLQGLSDLNYVKKQGVNGPIYALIALDSNHYEIPAVGAGGVQTTRENLIRAILDSGILDDGPVTGSRGKAPAALAVRTMHRKGTNYGSDPETIAMAIQALAPYYNENEEVRAAVDRGLRRLSELQQADGGYANAYGTSAECNAQVIVALTALGIDPHTDKRFVKEGGSVVDALSKYYVSNKGFTHEAGQDADVMATEQGYYALAAYYRFLTGQTALYDMSDVKIRTSGVLNAENTEVLEEAGGSAEEAGVIRGKTPDTGDKAAVAGYGSLALLSMLALAALLVTKKKHQS